MNRIIKLTVFYWLPVLFVAAMIFTLSSQSYEQQDLRPYIGQVTDIEKMKEMYNQIKMEHVQHRLYVEENGFKRTLQVIVERWKLLVVLLGALVLCALTIIIGFIIKTVRKDGFKKVLKALSIFILLAFVAVALAFVGILFAFRIEEFLLMIKERVAVGKAENWFKAIQFTYAGSEISVQQKGLDRFIEFLIRKAAHFSVFFMLGFLLYRAFWASGSTKLVGCFASLFFVLFYALTDEIHQAFTPNRTPLLEDVLLDFSGGLSGVTLALCIYVIITYYRNKPKQNVPVEITSRMERRRYKG
jgi:VanZ family protein